MSFLLVSAFLSHGLGQFPDGSLLCLTLLLVLLSVDCVGPFPTARRAGPGPGAASSLGATS